MTATVEKVQATVVVSPQAPAVVQKATVTAAVSQSWPAVVQKVTITVAIAFRPPPRPVVVVIW